MSTTPSPRFTATPSKGQPSGTPRSADSTSSSPRSRPRTAAPVIARARLRKGNTASATGVARLLAQAIKTVRAAGVTGRILTRADSAHYGWACVGTALRHKAWFSVTARMTPSVTAAIASIEASAWKAIEYPNAVFDEAEQRWVSDAEVAEIPFTAFTGRRKAEHVSWRTISHLHTKGRPTPQVGP